MLIKVIFNVILPSGFFMTKDSLSVNPLHTFSDSVNWFKHFIQMQDEVPVGLNDIKDDRQYIESRIIQVKTERPKGFEKSIFTSHQLKFTGFDIKDRSIMNPGWMAPLILFCFILLAFAQYGWYKRVFQIFKAFFVGRLFVQLAREGGLFNERVTLLLFLSYIIGFALFLFQIIIFFYGTPSAVLESFILFIKLLTGVTLLYIIKIALFRFSGFLFKSVKETSDYVLTIFVFGQIAGIVILPFLVLLTFLKSEIIIIAGLLLFSILYIYRFFRGAVTVTASSKISMYYIFLYLCTLEFLPLIFIAKGIIDLQS